MADLRVVESVLVLGGQKSGRTARAEKLAAAWLAQSAGHRAVYIATAQAWDEEMRERIALHRRDRAERVPRMETVEHPVELARAIGEHSEAGTLVVVDCLTLWLTAMLMPGPGPHPRPLPPAGEGVNRAPGEGVSPAPGEGLNGAAGEGVNRAAGEGVNRAAGEELNGAAGEELNGAAGEGVNRAAGEELNGAAGEELNRAAGDGLNRAAGDGLNRAAGEGVNRAVGEGAVSAANAAEGGSALSFSLSRERGRAGVGALLRDSLAAARGPLILISNEIGLGVIPMGRAVRNCVDTLGMLNQAAASACERVTLLSAGLPMLLKGQP